MGHDFCALVTMDIITNEVLDKIEFTSAKQVIKKKKSPIT